MTFYRRYTLGVVVAGLVAASATAKDLKVHGYVTAVHSPTSFELDEYKIMKDASITIDFDTDDDDDKTDFPVELRVGSEIEIKGDYNEETHLLQAKSVKAFTRESRKLKRTALVGELPRLSNRGTYWQGTFRVDGQSLIVDENTKVSIVPNTGQKKAAKQTAKDAKKPKSQKMDADVSEQALASLNELHAGMYVSYEGLRLDGGHVKATKMQFKDNEMTSGEAKLWKSLSPTVKNFKNPKPAELQLKGVGKFKLAPNDDVNAYVRRVGQSVIPPSQRSLPTGDENRIPFQFYVVEEKYPNAWATANGVVSVFTPMLAVLENEAQLAAVLAHEVAHATQEHTLRQMEFHKKKRTLLAIAAIAASAYGAYSVADLLSLTNAAIVNGYSRSLENQADRLGMEYMLAAGYDPREAPRVWKTMSLKIGDRPTNFFWDNHDNNTTRRSYLMSELRMNYPDVNFSALQKDTPEFTRIRGILREMYSGNKKIKVKF